jgi:hypothetical protein
MRCGRLPADGGNGAPVGDPAYWRLTGKEYDGGNVHEYYEWAPREVNATIASFSITPEMEAEYAAEVAGQPTPTWATDGNESWS